MSAGAIGSLSCANCAPSSCGTWPPGCGSPADQRRVPLAGPPDVQVPADDLLEEDAHCIPNRNSPPALLLREGYREGGKIIKRTLANLSHWDAQLVEHFRLLLKGGVAVESLDVVMTIERTLPHGHVAAVHGAAGACGAQKWFASAPEELRSVLLAMLCACVLWPASKLATHRMLRDDTAISSLGRVLGVGQCQVDDLYRALDWLHEAQPTIERALARKYLVAARWRCTTSPRPG